MLMLRLVARRYGAALLAGAIGAGCSLDPLPPVSETEDAGTKPSTCQAGFIGDPSRDLEMELTALGVDGASTTLADGDTMPLIQPPQGGRVIFAGVRAKNVDACGVRISGVLRDPNTDKIMLDARTVNLKPTPDGYAACNDSDISTFANIPICPNQWSSMDAFGSEYDLELSLKDREDRKAKVTLRVKLECAEPAKEAQCKCICKEGYVLGEKCDADAGAP